MKKTISAYLLDISKLTYGGVVLYAAVRQDTNLVTLIVVGAVAVITTAAVGFVIEYVNARSNKKNQAQ